MPASPDATILRKLRAAGEDYVAGAELGEAGRIAILREAGYVIEQHPHFGYRLRSSPDRLIADDIFSRLPECDWLREVLVFERTGSTNDLVTGLARQGALEGVVAFAEEQTAGRGRLGRRWESDPRLGLWFSILLRPEMPLAQWPLLTVWIAFAVAKGIEEFAGLRPMLKWPNDLYLSGRKLVGILVESSAGENAFATAGVGVNVNHTSFPGSLETTATSLRMATGTHHDRNGLAAAILSAIDRSVGMVPDRFDDVLGWAREADYLLGRWVSATVGSMVYEGTAHGLDADGALLIRTESGGGVRVTSGEVTKFSASTS